MIPIKFRAIKNHTNQWVYGNLIQDKYGNRYIIPFDDFELDGHHLRINSDEPVFIKNDTDGQYIGFEDDNGKEIYEDDICKIWFDVDKISNDIYLSLTDKEKELSEKIFVIENPILFNQPELYADRIEVIGNIYENPELMEGIE